MRSTLGRTLFVSGSACVLGAMAVAFADSLGRDGWTVAIGEGIGFGFYFGFLLWVLTLPGLVVYGAALWLWRRVGGWHPHLVALLLSPLVAVLPAWAFTRDGSSVPLVAWAVCVPVLAGFLVEREQGGARNSAITAG